MPCQRVGTVLPVWQLRAPMDTPTAAALMLLTVCLPWRCASRQSPSMRGCLAPQRAKTTFWGRRCEREMRCFSHAAWMCRLRADGGPDATTSALSAKLFLVAMLLEKWSSAPSSQIAQSLNRRGFHSRSQLVILDNFAMSRWTSPPLPPRYEPGWLEPLGCQSWPVNAGESQTELGSKSQSVMIASRGIHYYKAATASSTTVSSSGLAPNEASLLAESGLARAVSSPT